MRARNVGNAERLTEHTVWLKLLKNGDGVFIQNRTGNHLLTAMGSYRLAYRDKTVR